ncbi:hypothetical protein Q1695_012457 [Nippostrongylus brasiliensis]|nr:hypothetical protein Q1695_012457 [Nippostrongylus brasiliensis]
MRLLLLSSTLWVVASTMRKPDLYVWLEQNSYICDLSSGGIMPRFLSPDESKQFNCACGDPLISQAACARKGNEMPTCHSIPDLCMREYAILFTETSDRLAQPLTTRPSTVATTHPPPSSTSTAASTSRAVLVGRRPVPSPSTLRQLQRLPQRPTRRPFNREFLFRNRTPSRVGTRPKGAQRQNTFPLQLEQLNSSGISSVDDLIGRVVVVRMAKHWTFTFVNRNVRSDVFGGEPIPTDTASWSTTRTSSPSSANPTIIPIKYTTAKQNPIQKASASELSNRIKALGHKEPEHPLMDLKDFFEGKGKFKVRPDPTTASQTSSTSTTTREATTSTAFTTRKPTTTTPKVSTVGSTRVPELVDEEVRRETSTASVEISIRKVPQVEATINVENGKKPLIVVKPIPPHSQGDDEKKPKPLNDEAKHKKDEKTRVSVADPIPTDKQAIELDNEKLLRSQKHMRLPWHTQEEAIEYLRAKIEALETMLLDRIDKSVERRLGRRPAPPRTDNNDLVASDDEVVNIRRQSRLDSQRRNAINGDEVSDVQVLDSIDPTRHRKPRTSSR